MIVLTLAAIGAGVAGLANLIALLVRDRVGLQHIPRWQLALSAFLLLGFSLARAVSISLA